MIGILLAMVISWLLLHFIEKQSILALGFLPIVRRLKQFSIGFGIAATLCFVTQYLEAYLKSADWVINEHITSDIVLKSFWWDLKSVLTEELIFRGALLYILIRRIGSRKGIWISAIAFGIYHWFSYGVLGNPMAMLVVFLGTGLMGYAWAWAFSKTNSIFLAFRLHLGWNFIYNTIFSKGPLGELVMTLQGGMELSGWVSLFNFLSGLVIVPLLILVFVKYFVRNEPNEKSIPHQD